jgi:hypothetical protein
MRCKQEVKDNKEKEIKQQQKAMRREKAEYKTIK